MSMINYASREINCKIVYYGSGLGGKTTNLEHVYGKVQPDTRGKLISLATETERTLFFDFLPVDLGTIRGFKTRFHLYTVPGQVYYNASRKLILKGVDGIVFVADSQVERMEANQEAMQNLYDNMAEYGYDLTKMPFVIQYNKRDLPNAAPVRELQARSTRGGRSPSRAGSASRPDPYHAGENLVEQLPTGEWIERAHVFRGSRRHGRRRVRDAERRQQARAQVARLSRSPSRREPSERNHRRSHRRHAADRVAAARRRRRRSGSPRSCCSSSPPSPTTSTASSRARASRRRTSAGCSIRSPTSCCSSATFVPMYMLMRPSPHAEDELASRVRGERLPVPHPGRRRPAALVDAGDRARPRGVHDDLPPGGGAARRRDRRDRPREVEDGVPVDLGRRRLLLVLRRDAGRVAKLGRRSDPGACSRTSTASSAFSR